MEKIDIKKIKTNGNVRKDLGDLTEMTQSIKEVGVRTPIELDNKDFIVDGHRRFNAAKAAGLKEVPYFRSGDKLSKIEAQLIAGIHQKSLSAVEEAEGFDSYLKNNKKTSTYLAKKIGKTAEYIERRLTLLSASKDTKEALQKGSIQIGHAVILSRMDAKEQKMQLGYIKDREMSVADLANEVKWGKTARLSDAVFDMKECSNCKFNGGSQMLLTDIGSKLTGMCMNPGCYHKKTDQWLADEKEKLIIAGVNVMDLAEIQKLPYYKHLDQYCWRDEDKKAYNDAKRTIEKNKDKKPEVYAVAFKRNHAKIPERLYFLIEKPKGQKADKKKTKKAESKLKEKIDVFKRELQRKTIHSLIKPGSKEVKALTLWGLLDRYNDAIESDEEELAKLLKGIEGYSSAYWDKKDIDALYKLPEKTLDAAIALLSKMICFDMDNGILSDTAPHFGYDPAKHFIMTEEFLQNYTIDELKALSIEFGWTVSSSKKKEIIGSFIEQWKPGEVPKILK